jgi:hypothetical protein
MTTAPTVCDYATGDQLTGTAHPSLVTASKYAGHEGAVPALCDRGVWRPVAPSEVDQMRRMGWAVRTVYVEVGS